MWVLTIVVICSLLGLFILALISSAEKNHLGLWIAICGLILAAAASFLSTGKPSLGIREGYYTVVAITEVSRDAHLYYNLLLEQDGKVRYYVLSADRVILETQEIGQPPVVKVWTNRVGFYRTPVKRVTLTINKIPTVAPLPSKQPY